MRTSPNSDSASLGFGEQINWTLASMFRTNKSSVEKRFDVVIGPNSQIVPWLIRYISWVKNRFSVGKDGLT